MDSSIKAAIITAVASVAAAVIGIWKGWAKKPNATPETGGNITHHLKTVQNYYGVASPPAGPFHGKVATRPSIVEIANAILAVKKPYDRTQIPKNYIGLKVSWPVIFSSIDPNSEGSWYAFFDSPDEDYRSVSTCIDIEKYPKLKVIEYGHPAWIEGRILYTNVRDTRLEDDADITLA